MLSPIAKILDGFTMYRVVIYGLLFIALIAVGVSFTEYKIFEVSEIVFQFIFIVALSLGVNALLAQVFRAPLNHEPALVTALILFFLINPSISFAHVFVMSIAVIGAMVSKYVIAWKKRHIFNPAAVGAVILGLLGIFEPTWWIGSTPLFIPMLIVGLLIAWKIRRFDTVIPFFIVGFALFFWQGLQFDDSLLDSLRLFFVSGPALFLGFVMLTEPLTTPSTKQARMLYGAAVGFFVYTSAFNQIGVIMVPELALLIGNLVAFPFVQKDRLILELIETKEVAKNTLEFVFKKPKGFSFRAGQYLEWTIPHKNVDSRGVRRYFTVASAPEEKVVRLGVRIAEQNGSSFKRALMDLAPGDVIYATQRAGDFLLPKDTKKKLVFIAGGIGVTPFRSQIQEMISEERERDIVFFYANRTPDDIAYGNLFRKAGDFGLRVVHLISDKETARDGDEKGFLSKEIVKRHVPDFKERMFYISGPNAMVVAYKKLLTESGVPPKNIHTDYFPGLA